MRKKAMGSPFLPPHYGLSVLDNDGHDSLHAEGHMGDKSCPVISDTGASMMVTRPDITGLPERDLLTKCALQTAPGETLPILKEVLVTLTLGRHPLITSVFIANITDEFILGLNVMHAHNASMNLRHHVV
jgi:hypothetical protein